MTDMWVDASHFNKKAIVHRNISYLQDFNMVKAYSRPRTNEEKSYVKPEWRHLAFGGESRSGTKICWTAWSVWVRVPPVLHEIEVWCNGSTTDFGSASPGSNPGTSTKLNREVHSNFMQYTQSTASYVSPKILCGKLSVAIVPSIGHRKDGR